MYVVEKVAELKKKDLLLIYSFCIKNLYSYLYILQNGVVNTSLLKHFQNETLPWSLGEGTAAAPLRDAGSRCAHSWAVFPAGTHSFAVGGLMAGKAAHSPQKARPIEILWDLALASGDPLFRHLFSQALVWGLRRHLGQQTMLSGQGGPCGCPAPAEITI